MPGFAPAKSIHMMRLEGNPQKKALPTYDWVPATKLPAPKMLSGRAKALWYEIVPKLILARRIGEEEWMGLVALCKLWARYEALLAEMDGIKNASVESDGHIRPHPTFATARSMLNQIMALWREYGLTPASRNRTLQTTASTDNDDMLGY